MSKFQFESDSFQSYDKWINIVLDCFLRAGGLKIGGKIQGTCLRFDP